MQAGSDSGAQPLILTDNIEPGSGHHLDEGWLRARVRGWMHLIESPDQDFWIGSYTADGKWIYCSSRGDTWAPHPAKQDFAMKVCQHVNRQAAGDGAWLTGWRLGNREFYMLHKDVDGDIQIPIEFGQGFSRLREWELHIFENHAVAALGIFSEFKRAPEAAKSQLVKVAQGEKVSKDHYRAGVRASGLA